MTEMPESSVKSKYYRLLKQIRREFYDEYTETVGNGTLEMEQFADFFVYIVEAHESLSLEGGNSYEEVYGIGF